VTAPTLAAAQTVLRAQIAVRMANVSRARAALDGVANETPTAVRNQFVDRLRVLERDLDALSRRALGPADDGSWLELEHLARQADEQVAETFGFIGGALIRRAAMDSDLCPIADTLLDELSEATRIAWPGLTILAPAESFAQRARIVHLRFPEFTVWALPLAAHEFGHLVAQEQRELGIDGVYDQLVAEEIAAAREVPIAHARELFADVFATYALGPAYPCTAILLRFSPLDADTADADATHPNDGKRVVAMLEALRWLSETDASVSSPYHQIASLLERAWHESAQAAQRSADIDEDQRGNLTFLVRHSFLPLLDRHLEPGRYAGWPDALRIARQLRGGATAGRVMDILNAAWQLRLRTWTDATEAEGIDDRALALCRSTARRAGRLS
jgi:hypothetical protein